MNIWIVTVGEPLPTDGGSVRLLRHGILAQMLVERGHQVLWWSSTFDHQRKQQRHDRDTFLEVAPGYRLGLLHGRGYRRNVSLARLLNHRELGRRFPLHAARESPPDVILCSFPTIELSVEAVRYGRDRGVPVVVDVRDMWPDIFLEAAPGPARPLAQFALRGMHEAAATAFRGSTALLAMSEGVLQWALRKADRPARANDRVFPLAYRRNSAAPEAVEAAGQRLREKGVDPSRRICWFIGQFGRQYDLETIVQAARELARSGDTAFQFVFSGDGDKRRHLEAQAAGLENVVFTGWIGTPEIAHLMSVAQVGLAAAVGMPGTLPNKLFEYFSAGLPVLSTIQGEAAALLAQHDCGLTYTAGDVAGLLRGLEAMRDEARRGRMASNAAALFESSYSSEVVYPRMVDLLTSVGRSAARPGRVSDPATLEAADAGQARL